MKIRRLYKSLYSQLRAQYEGSNEIKHSGGKGANREFSIIKLLQEYLPSKYSLGSGEIISSVGEISRQCDIVIHDNFNSPKLFQSNEHSIFAAEAVFGVIEVKSNLNSVELKNAIQNIAVAKKTVYHKLWRSHDSNPLFSAIVGFTANRSIEAIAKQIDEHYSSLSENERNFFPDFILTFDKGIIEPGSFGGLCKFYRTEQNTFLHFMSKTLNFLNQIKLQPLNLADYIGASSKIDELSVERHDRFIFSNEDGRNEIKKLTDKTILKIYKTCQSEGKIEVLSNEEITKYKSDESFLGFLVAQHSYVFNPSKRKIIFESQVKEWKEGRAVTETMEFFPEDYIKINGEIYYLDLISMKESDFELNRDITSGDIGYDVIRT